MSKPIALPCDLAEPAPVAVATTAISQAILRVPAQILPVLVRSRELAAVLVSGEAVSVGFNLVVALLVERVQQRAISALGLTTSHATARLRQ
jgi:hypothetical protein